jgi:hypothetical protein
LSDLDAPVLVNPVVYSPVPHIIAFTRLFDIFDSKQFRQMKVVSGHMSFLFGNIFDKSRLLSGMDSHPVMFPSPFVPYPFIPLKLYPMMPWGCPIFPFNSEFVATTPNMLLPPPQPVGMLPSLAGPENAEEGINLSTNKADAAPVENSSSHSRPTSLENMQTSTRHSRRLDSKEANLSKVPLYRLSSFPTMEMSGCYPFWWHDTYATRDLNFSQFLSILQGHPIEDSGESSSGQV